jgi:membrane protein DedA with SNARE-associated domain
MLSLHALPHLLHSYGYGLIAGVVGLEALGLPLPGESMLIAAALYAGTSQQLSVPLVVASAAVGAIVGDNAGYAIGREIGFRMLARFGRHIGLNEQRLRVGQYLFERHGAKVVFFGRFVAILRTFAAILAGANRMDWKRFLLWNAIGGVAWSCLYGFGAYALGKAVSEVARPLGIALGIIAAILVVAGIIFLKRNETRLLEAAKAASKGKMGQKVQNVGSAVTGSDAVIGPGGGPVVG